MKMLNSFSIKRALVGGLVVAMFPAAALANTCKGSAGAVYLLVQDKAHPTDNSGTNPFVGDAGMAVGGPKGGTWTLDGTASSSYCARDGGSADSHYPTSTTWNPRNFMEVDSSGHHAGMLHDNVYWPGTPQQPGTRFGYCEPTNVANTPCISNGTNYAYKVCCCHEGDCSA